MTPLIFAAALANSITAPYGISAHAQWGAARPNVELILENRSEVKAWLVDVTCNAYDRRGVLVGVSTASLAQLQPGERVKTWAVGDTTSSAVRFVCKVGVNEWQRAN